MKLRLLCLLAVCLLSIPLTITAQKIPISFDKYHGYSGTVDYLQKVHSAYPGITELLTIGKSNMGRDIHVLVISNMKNGTTIDRHIKLFNERKEGVDNVIPSKTHQGKPGHFISGSTHGNEYTGTEVCLYIIDKLLSGYATDDKIKDLIDKDAFYICPTINPDGVYNSVELGIAQRSNSLLKDNDEDGKINEDGPDDINSDGKISSFRYPDEKGMYVMDDADPRVMVRLGRNAKTDKPRYSVIREDLDNDKDGKRGEDSESGIDLNRNYPEGWWNDKGFAGGSGDYPTSAPETHAIAEFFTNYRNILMAQFYHTSGGFTFRPMGTAPHTKMHKDDVAVLDLVMGKKYLEIIGEEVPEAWQNPEKIPALKKKMATGDADKYSKMRGYELPRGWRVSYSEKSDRRYGYGMATDWLFLQYGIYSITTELWNPRADIPGLELEEGSNDRASLERALLKYQDEKYDGKLFIDWKAFKHPELGDGEVGGWISQYARNNAFPGEPLLKVCEDHWQFELFRAGLMPEIEITDVKSEILYSGSAKEGSVKSGDNTFKISSGKAKGKYHVVKISATIKNNGQLGTNLAKGATLPGNRNDVVWLVGNKGDLDFIEGKAFKSIGSLGGVLKVAGLKQQPSSSDLEWIVAVKDKSELKIVVSSLKGGTTIKTITIK